MRRGCRYKKWNGRANGLQPALTVRAIREAVSVSRCASLSQLNTELEAGELNHVLVPWKAGMEGGRGRKD